MLSALNCADIFISSFFECWAMICKRGGRYKSGWLIGTLGIAVYLVAFSVGTRYNIIGKHDKWTNQKPKKEG